MAATENQFDKFTLNRLREIVSGSIAEGYKENRLFVDGDHWQSGEGWVGPMPPDNVSGSSNVRSEIEKGFLSKNVIREIKDRHTNGVLGRSPVWTFSAREQDADSSLKDSQEEAIAEAEQGFTIWWDKRNAHDKLKESLGNLLASGRAVARVYIPLGMGVDLGEGKVGVNVAQTLEQALNYIYLDIPDVEAATIYTDPLTKQELGVFIYKPIDPETGKEKQSDAAELVYLIPDEEDEPALTAVQTLDSGANDVVPLDIGGRLTMHEMRRPLFITEQIRAQQKALNLALSMVPRNVVTSGFLERVILNAEMPGEWEYKDGKPVKFIPAQYVTGAATTNALRGLAVEQPDGKRTLTTPDIKWRDPSPVKPAVDAAQAIYLAMLEEAKQAHIILSGEALVSGKSREQARSDFDMSLNESKIPCEHQGQWLLETVLALAEMLMGQPGKYTLTLRATFQCHTFTGPVTWEERKQNDDSIGKTISQQRAMEMNGILDVDSELARIKQESVNRIDHVKAQAEAYQQLVNGGMSNELAGTLVGFDSKIISGLKKLDQVALEQQDEVEEE